MNRKNLQNISLNDLDKSEIKEKNENFLTAENINIKSRYTKNDLKNILKKYDKKKFENFKL